MKQLQILLFFSLVVAENHIDSSINSPERESIYNSINNTQNEDFGYTAAAKKTLVPLALGTAACTGIIQAGAYATGIPVDLKTSIGSCAFLTNALVMFHTTAKNELNHYLHAMDYEANARRIDLNSQRITNLENYLKASAEISKK